ncbi:hypothetical protein [Dyella jiangningensis]|uniref:Lipoprotein n=1 Tax=Dyella jiangningensis TaxID=1379159 RepID=A0A328PBE3_9GAMM|nr:hypothetical protein [Dyella jiangningensis]RAO77434.1 hypothetical protein CA260_06035 [Dyella jiangningensis]
MPQRSTTWWVSALIILPLAACSASSNHEATDNASGSSDAASATPPIHVRQTMVVLRDGQPASEQNYRQALADCRKGPFPTQPLGDDVAGKLGRTFYDVWYEGARVSEHAERWDYETTGTCQFKLVHESTLAIIKPGEAVTVDLIGKTGTRQPSDGVMRETRVDDGDDKAAKPADSDDDAALRAAVAAQLSKQGKGDLMAHAGGTDTAAGQPCKRLDQPGIGESCVWSGGRKWGFSSDVVDDTEGLNGRLDSILLWRHPPQGTGKQWTTEKMTVGEAIDGKVFEVPSGIAVSATN